jgi:hypothetical protein
MNNNQTFTYINDSKICEIIASTQIHIIYAAPSLSKDIAEAILKFSNDNQNGLLKIIVDEDSEAFIAVFIIKRLDNRSV